MIEFLFEPYKNYPLYQIILEFIAMSTGIASVMFAKKNNILVYPIGLISTSIYVFLLFKWDLIGDMLVNVYYSNISIYGWYLWTKSINQANDTGISHSTIKDYLEYAMFFLTSIVIIVIIYKIFNKFDTWYSYIDTFTSATFFVAMWCMAKRKIEHWLFWIIGNIISIPLYFLKGYTITAFQYVIFLILAIFGYLAWKNIYNRNQQTS